MTFEVALAEEIWTAKYRFGTGEGEGDRSFDETAARVARAGWRIYEVGISYDGRTYEEGKKITWRDGLRALYAIIKYNFFAGGPRRVAATAGVRKRDPSAAVSTAAVVSH